MGEKLTKLLEDLRSGAVRLVPGEATDEMVQAVYNTMPEGDAWGQTIFAQDLYAATLSACPDLTPALVEMIEGLVRERDEARGVLSGLSSCFGAGLGDDTTTAEQFDRRIREGVEITYAPMVEAWRKEIAK